MRGWVAGGREAKYERCLPEPAGSAGCTARKKTGAVVEKTPEETRRKRDEFAERAKDCGCKSIRREKPMSRSERTMLNRAGEARLRRIAGERGDEYDSNELRAQDQQWGDEEDEEEVDSVGAEDYEPSEDSDDDDDPLEYASDAESELSDDDTMDVDDLGGEDLGDFPDDVSGWTFSVGGPDPFAVIDTDFAPISASWVKRRPRRRQATDEYEILDESETASEAENEHEHGDNSNDASQATLPRDYHHQYLYEHIAGPDCVHEDGYHGDRISVDEMLHSRTAQFLAAKELLSTFSSRWEPEDDDLDFERASSCFLTGLSRGSPQSDDNAWLSPIRHEVDNVYCANFSNGYSEVSLASNSTISLEPSYILL